MIFCSLSNNQIFEEGACVFAGALEVNQSLQELKWVSREEITFMEIYNWPSIVFPLGKKLKETLISYTFLVADYWSSTSNFDSLVKSTLSYCLATLQRIPRIHTAFYGNSASLEDQPTSQKGFV